MASKITIRRVGGLLPAICLVVLVLLASVIVWLSTAGLPDSALRAVEAEAAKQGIYLRIGKLKLSPASGLAVRARGVELYATAKNDKPLATLERATLGISAAALLRGKLQPTKAEFRNLDVALPTDGEAPLMIEDMTVSTVIRRGRYVRFTSASARLEGIPVTLHGAFMLPEASPSAENEDKAPVLPLDLPALLRPLKESAGAIQRSIAGQAWLPEERPSIELRLIALRTTQLSARINIPRYDEEQFHFRDAFIDVAYQNNAVIINKVNFHTVEPDSEVTLQGGYDIPARHLSVNLRSTAALTRMAETVALHGVDMVHGVDMKNIISWLERFRHPDDAPPAISLRGDVYFEEDFSPKSLSVTGQLSQQNFAFGNTEIDDLHLSFYYRDGSFNVDRLQLAFPTGSLILSASASSDSHKGKARVIADLDIPQLLKFASEFTPEPLTLPEGLVLSGNLRLDASAELDMPAFISGSTSLDQFLPALRKVELKVGIDEASHFGHSMVRPQLTINLNDLKQKEGKLLPHALGQAQLSFRADRVYLPRPSEDERGTTLRKAELDMELRELVLDDGCGQEGAPSPCIGSASGNLRLGSLMLPGLNIEAVEAELSDTTHIRPLADGWRSMLQQAALRLSTGAMLANGTLLGAMDSKLRLHADGNIDLTSVLDREGHRMHVTIHPRLTEDGLFILDQMQLELPAAGFAPLLALTGTDINWIQLPDTLTLAGNATYDTRNGYLRHAEAQLHIPHLVRTPGSGVAVFKGKEIPLSLQLHGKASGQENGQLSFDGRLTVVHKTGRSDDMRELKLDFSGNTASHIHFEGSSTIDVRIADQLIDLHSAHVIMRDFDSNEQTRTDVVIRGVDINWTNGLTVSADCDARVRSLGYQMNAFSEEKDAQGNPTGKESLRRDFGKSPFRRIEKGTAHVDVLYRHDAAGKVQDSRVSILNADVTYDNRPWLRQMGIKNGVNSSRLQGEAVIIDIKDSFVELRNIHGKAYPAYAIGAYYDALPGFMADVIVERPATLETQHCVFPFSKKSPRDMAGSISMKAERAGYRFLGTTFPFTSFSGFIWFKPGIVGLDRLNAACWDGALNAAINIDYSGKTVGFDGYANVRNVNLKPLAAAYGSKQAPALCNGSIRFRTPAPELKAMQAYGDVHIVNGDLMNLRIFRPVGALIADLPGNLAALERKALNTEGMKPTWLDRQITKLFKKTGQAFSNVGESVGRIANNIPFANHFLSYNLQEMHSGFTINNGKLVTDDFKALGNNLNVGIQLEVDLANQRLDGDLWPRISSVPTIILSPITFLSDFMIDIRVFGPFNDIDWKFGLNRKRRENAADSSVTSEVPKKGRSAKRH